MVDVPVIASASVAISILPFTVVEASGNKVSMAESRVAGEIVRISEVPRAASAVVANRAWPVELVLACLPTYDVGFANLGIVLLVRLLHLPQIYENLHYLVGFSGFNQQIVVLYRNAKLPSYFYPHSREITH